MSPSLIRCSLISRTPLTNSLPSASADPSDLASSASRGCGVHESDDPFHVAERVCQVKVALHDPRERALAPAGLP